MNTFQRQRTRDATMDKQLETARTTVNRWLRADFSTLKMEAIRSSETSVHTRSTRRHIPEDGIQ
jgi:hypothetical protein